MTQFKPLGIDSKRRNKLCFFEIKEKKLLNEKIVDVLITIKNYRNVIFIGNCVKHA